ncbi:uncharacterized protein LOC120339391 [Styela clava]
MDSLILLKVFLLSCFLWGIVASQSCTAVDSCTCDMDDSSGRINLHSLALDGFILTDSAFTTNGGDGWYYKYNPCNGFNQGGYTDLAVAQVDIATGFSVYDLGVQSSSSFNYTEDSGLTLHYTASDGARKSRVKLICEPNVEYHRFEVVGELIITEYDFILTSTCACPGLCDENGVIPDLSTLAPVVPGVSCNKIDSCTCEMSDGSGRINLHGPALEGTSLYDAAFMVYSGGWYYKYNPCNGYSLGGYSDLAIFQSSDQYPTWGYDLGVQTGSYFNYTEGNGLSIHYTAYDGARTSRVLLICQSGGTDHTVEFLGELVITEYDFVMTSPCACPGACNNNGIIATQTTPPPSVSDTTCNFVDSCTCDMSDGSGQINLHALALSGPALYDSQYTLLAYDGWYYKYNPCNGFSMHSYTDLALYQTDVYESYGYDLGVQSSAKFIYSDTDGLSIHYKSGENVRSSKVLLICEPGINAHKFEYVGELIILEYEFILTTPCACPGMCDNNGPTIDLPTPPPGTGEGDGTCTYIDSCTCDMADGSGMINLKSLSLQDDYLYDSAFTEYGSDGFYYKYNPCYGFYFNYYYGDTALAQSYDFYGSHGVELGTQSSAFFNYTEGSGLAINYRSSDQYSSSRVLLICEPNTDQHKFQFIGELVWYEYDFTLTTPCACPGGCDDYGLVQAPEGTYCNAVDSCTCDMSDGSGRINLKSLALTSGAAFTSDGLDGWLYKYNPCNGFDVVYYYDVAVAQVNIHGTSGHDLGSQDSAKFQYSESAGLSLHYVSDDRTRESRVLLICDPATTEAVFDFVGELVTLEYEFILKSACACAGGCNDFGIIGGGGSQQNGGDNTLPDTIHVNVDNSDTSSYLWTSVGGIMVGLIFHDLFLILAIAVAVLVAKRTMTLCFDPARNGPWSSNYDRFKDVAAGQPSA